MYIAALQHAPRATSREKIFPTRLNPRRRRESYETNEKEVVKKIGCEHMTVTAYVDNILRHHLELYKDDINRIHKEQNTKELL